MRKQNYRRRRTARTKRRQGGSMIIPIIVGVVLVAMVAGIIIFSEGGTPTAAGSLPYPNVPRIGLEESQEKLAQGSAVLVDVRSSDAYGKSHAVGAISIPEEEVGNRLDELPRDKEIILYCT